MADSPTLNISYECPKGMVLIGTAGDADPDRPPFCIQIYETTQEEYDRFFSSEQQACYKLTVDFKDGKVDEIWDDESEEIEASQANYVTWADVSGTRIETIMVPPKPHVESNLWGPKKPAMVEWHRAREYCMKTYAFGDLPTMWQWRATCGGIYCGIKEDELTPQRARYDARAVGTARVGSYPPTNNGLYDMIGNAREWTLGNNCMGAKYLMGGDYESGKFHLRSDQAFIAPPVDYKDGFRCVAPATKTTQKCE